MEPAPLIRSGTNGLPANQGIWPESYDQPPRVTGYPTANTQDSILRDYLHIAIKRKWVILGCLITIFGGVVLATFRSTPIYEAVGSIAINKNDPTQLSFKDSANAGQDYYDPSDLDTEARILRSDLLALQVIRQLHLDKPGSGANQNGLPLSTDSLNPDSPQTADMLAEFKSNLRVSLVPDTRVIEIAYRSPDKTLAPKVVNTLTSTYVEQNFKTRFESTMQASDWLSKQLVDLQMKVESSQEKLVKYQKEHEILGGDEKQNITTEKLDELNRDLTAAEATRMEKESVYRLVQSGDPDSVAAAAASTAAASSAAGGSSSLLDKLRGQEADLRIQTAQLSTQFGPAYPKVAQLTSQLKEIDVQIQAEMRKIVVRLHGEYLAALQREDMLHAALEKQKQEANKLNESAIEYSLLKRDLDSNRTLYEGLLEKLKEAGVTASLRSNNFRIVDVARVPTAPVEPNIPRNLALGLALGLSTGLGLAFLLDAIDNTVRTPEQANAICGLPSLGMIPLGSRQTRTSVPGKSKLALLSSQEAVELITQVRPQSRMAESYRALRTSILLTSVGTPPKVIVITSSLPQEGKTTTSINCAVVLAQKGARVLLIDADLRRPSIHKTLGMGPRTGLSNVLTGSASAEQATVRSTILSNLFVLPAGTPPPNPAELLASAPMKELLTQLRGEYDHIVIDTPPALSVTDAVVMATRADTVILVIRSEQTTRQALRRTRDLLAQVNARVAGVLLNAVDLNSADYRYYSEYQEKYSSRYYQEDGGVVAEESIPEAAVEGD